MKVLHLSTHDFDGGAAKAFYRIHKSLLRCGVDSRAFVLKKKESDPTVEKMSGRLYKILSFLSPYYEKILLRFVNSRSKSFRSLGVSLVSKRLVNAVNKSDADIVHLHWVNGGFFSIKDLPRLTKPVVWTLHDMWPFLGSFHYSMVASSDLFEKFLLNRKKSIFKNSSYLNILCVSEWLKNEAERSLMFEGHLLKTIPNTIDAISFSPVDRVEARKILKIPQDIHLVCFGAESATSDIRKGYSMLREAVRRLKVENLGLLIFGGASEIEDIEGISEVFALGYISDEISMRVVYSAADVMAVPSIQEAFGQTALEAMSCGVPVVAFSGTGVEDIVEHKVNGYLAKHGSSEDLANGIEWILKSEHREKLALSARSRVIEKFDGEVIGPLLCEFYRDVLRRKDKDI